MILLASPIRLGELIDSAENLISGRLLLLGGDAGIRKSEIRGDQNLSVDSIGSSGDELKSSSLTFAVKKEFLHEALRGGAGAIISSEKILSGVRKEHQSDLSKTIIISEDPRLLFAGILEIAETALKPKNSVTEPFFKDKASTQIDPSVTFGPYSYVGAGVVIKKGASIGPGVIIEDDVSIGEDSCIHPGVTLRWRVKIGSRVIIHAGCVIGEDGFGYTQLPQKNGRLIHFKNSHLGSVSIEDDVEIGALSCVDRGLVDDTTIKKGTKLDNLVQVGHNCLIGSDCIVVAQVGVGGHSEIGDRVFLLGQSGVSHGVKIGSDAIITGQCGVTGVIPPGKRAWSGTPSVPMDENLKTQALLRRYLPRLRDMTSAIKSSKGYEEFRTKFLGEEKDDKNKS
jgi:UDP-3-O-[3-hydroxymyristoyl] glucosamine N-acyltransferase